LRSASLALTVVERCISDVRRALQLGADASADHDQIRPKFIQIASTPFHWSSEVTSNTARTSEGGTLRPYSWRST
jgi:hypothetical protein